MTASLTRNEFVKLAATFAGSLTLGIGAAGCSNPNATTAAKPDGPPFVPNAWLAVHPNERVTITVSKSEMGQGVATGLPTLIAEELDVPFEQVDVVFAPAAPAYLDKAFFNLQMTGGSTSMPHSWMMLRTAGASARAMLVAAAAKQWNVDPSTCTTANGVVTHASSNRTATYGSLVAAASTLPVPQTPVLKTPAQFTLIGKDTVKRTDTPLKVNGSAQYGIDVRVPDMKFASVERPPTFGGTVRTFDASKAKAVPGVIDVVQIPSGVAVVASNSWAAFQGRRALQIAWNDGPNATLDDAAIFADSERLATTREGAKIAVTRGNTDVSGAKTLTAIYRGPWHAHATMEPMNATAHVHDGEVEIWAPTQGQTLSQLVASKIAGVSPAKVTVHTTYLGGGFGRRLETDFVEDAVAVSKAIHAPVQVIWTREDDMTHDYYRPLTVNAVRGTLDAQGNLVALDHTIASESIVRAFFPTAFTGIDFAQVDNVANVLYEIPNMRASYIDSEHGVPVGFLRAPGANWNAFVTESFIDELAHAAGKDPVAFRLEMLKKNPRAVAVIKTAAQAAGWGTSRTPGAKQGIAFATWSGGFTALVAEVTMKGGMPVVHRAVIACDCGTIVNPDIATMQLESAVNYGLSLARASKITIKNGRVEQKNFDTFEVLRMADAPAIEVHLLPSSAPPTGIGEIGTPPVAPAVSNAVFALIGKRARTLPFRDALA